jgi:hypothetical protein
LQLGSDSALKGVRRGTDKHGTRKLGFKAYHVVALLEAVGTRGAYCIDLALNGVARNRAASPAFGSHYANSTAACALYRGEVQGKVGSFVNHFACKDSIKLCFVKKVL